MKTKGIVDNSIRQRKNKKINFSKGEKRPPKY